MLSKTKNWILSTLAIVCVQVMAFAQDGGLIDVDVDLDSNEWYENPWIWVGVGAFVVILVLASRRKA